MVVLLIIAILAFFVKKNRGEKKLTPLAGLAFAFIIAGIIFSESRWVGYSLIGVGVLLAVTDIIIKLKKK